MATGSINAQLALIAAGTISDKGLSSTATAAAASIGISKAVVAVLEVASVINVTAKQTNKIISQSGRLVKCVSASPAIALSPELTDALAKQIPAANKINTPHGI